MSVHCKEILPKKSIKIKKNITLTYILNEKNTS